MTVRNAICLGLAIWTTGCSPVRPVTQPRLEDLPVVDYPLEIYEAILDELSPPGRSGYLVVEDVTQICYDFEHRHALFKDYFAALDAGFREAHRDCASKGSVDFRVPVEQLAPRVAIRSRGSFRRHVPERDHPTIFLSRPGINADSTRAVVDVAYYCGQLCEESSIFGFERRDGRWHLVMKKGMFQS